MAMRFSLRGVKLTLGSIALTAVVPGLAAPAAASTGAVAVVISGPGGAPGAAFSTVSVNEGQSTVATFSADRPVTWLIDNGGKAGIFPVPEGNTEGASDAARFRIDPSSGVLAFVAPPDFEAPADSDRNNTYLVRVSAVDMAGNSSSQLLTVTVLNVEEIAGQLSQIGPMLRAGLRAYAANGLSDMLSYHEALIGDRDSANCERSDSRAFVTPTAGEEHEVSAGYRGRLVRCSGRIRVYAKLALTYASREEHSNVRWYASFGVERELDPSLTVGGVVLASRSSETVGGFRNSTIKDAGFQIVGYSRYDLGGNLRTGGFFGLGRSAYEFSLSDKDGLALDGKMIGRRQVYGWTLSGQFVLGGTVITTDAVVSRAREKLGAAQLAARYLSEERTNVSFAVGEVQTSRVSLPFAAQFRLAGNERLGPSAKLLLKPGLLCEDNDIERSSLRCGYQLGARLTARDRRSGQLFAEYRWESVAGLHRSLLGLGYAFRFARQPGLELALEGGQGLLDVGVRETRALASLRLAR